MLIYMFASGTRSWRWLHSGACLSHRAASSLLLVLPRSSSSIRIRIRILHQNLVILCHQRLYLVRAASTLWARESFLTGFSDVRDSIKICNTVLAVYTWLSRALNWKLCPCRTGGDVVSSSTSSRNLSLNTFLLSNLSSDFRWSRRFIFFGSPLLITARGCIL